MPVYKSPLFHMSTSGMPLVFLDWEKQAYFVVVGNPGRRCRSPDVDRCKGRAPWFLMRNHLPNGILVPWIRRHERMKPNLIFLQCTTVLSTI
jgi:hypothetical protein